MSQDFKINTLSKGLKLHLPLTDKHLDSSSLPLDLTAYRNHAASEIGSPTYGPDGVDLTSYTDGIVFPASGVFNHDKITIAFRFNPDVAFNGTGDNNFHFFDTVAGGSGLRYRCVKDRSGLGNDLIITLGDTNIEILDEVWSSYWTVGEENTIVITAQDTAQLINVWFNGNHILVDDTTAWTYGDPGTLYIGSLYDGTPQYDGKIRDFRVWNRVITEQERKLYENGSGPVYYAINSLEKGLVLDIPLTSEWMQDSNTVSDRSAYRNQMVTNGSPTFDSNGVTLDGVDGYFYQRVLNYRGDDQQGTVSFWAYPTGTNNGECIAVSSEAIDGNSFLNFGVREISGDKVIQIYGRINGTNNRDVRTTNTSVWGFNEWHHVLVKSDGSNTIIYVNGVNESITTIGGADDGRWFADIPNTDNFCIGALFRSIGLSIAFEGTLTGVKVWNRALSEAEILQLYKEGR